MFFKRAIEFQKAQGRAYNLMTKNVIKTGALVAATLLNSMSAYAEPAWKDNASASSLMQKQESSSKESRQTVEKKDPSSVLFEKGFWLTNKAATGVLKGFKVAEGHMDSLLGALQADQVKSNPYKAAAVAVVVAGSVAYLGWPVASSMAQQAILNGGYKYLAKNFNEWLWGHISSKEGVFVEGKKKEVNYRSNVSSSLLKLLVTSQMGSYKYFYGMMKRGGKFLAFLTEGMKKGDFKSMAQGQTYSFFKEQIKARLDPMSLWSSISPVIFGAT